jgi:predicted ATPase
MYFNEIEIENYKCYNKKVSLKLEKGINIIFGKNNVGKTALLEALSLTFEDNPHNSLATFPKPNRPNETKPKVTINFTIDRERLRDLFQFSLSQGNSEFKFPVDLSCILETDRLINTSERNSLESYKAGVFAKHYLSSDFFTLKIEKIGDKKYSKWETLADSYIDPKITIYQTNGGEDRYFLGFYFQGIIEDVKFKGQMIPTNNSSYSEDFICRVAAELHRFIFRFRAERIPSEPCKLGQSSKLLPDCTNLAAVIHLLQGNKSNFNKFNKLINKIFPNIFQIGVFKNERYEGENKITVGQVVVWNSKKEVDYNHLSRTLDQVGSGVGQVIALLYVLFNSDEPQVILIDEPQSFLHPDATRKLVEIMSVYGKKHQIIIATHTPTIISACDPSTVTLVKQKGTESTFEQIDINQVNNQMIYLSEVGARLSDVFGFDSIIWVEGLTEEICFPMILRKVLGKPLLGTAILSVFAVTDFENADKTDVDRITSIYERLSKTPGGLVPKAVSYIFDKEDRSEKKISDLQEQCKNLHFTKKRMYENYLLDAEAIVSVIQKTDKNAVVDIAKVESSIDEKKLIRKYYQPFDVPEDISAWKETIHGKRLLKDIFKEFCTTQETKNYKEKKHSVMLTEWVIENSPEDLKELGQLIKKAMEGK